MPTIGSLTSFTANTLAQASQVNSNFSTIRTAVNTYCAFLDATSQTFTGNQTFNPSSGVALTVTDGGITVSADGITVTGNSTITGTLGGVTTLSCTTVTATNLGGTLTTAAQPNITSFGTLTSLTIGGALSGVTTLTMTAAASKIVPGVTSFSLRNNADNADNLIVTNAGAVTVRSHLMVTGVIGGNGGGAISISPTTLSITTTQGLVVIGNGSALDTAAETAGILQIARCSGVPTGTVNDGAQMLDTTNHRIYYRSGGAWKYAALT
jgi:hypothetical protein